MKVWVAEGGEYSGRYIAGIYDTPARAMAALGGKWTRTVWLEWPRTVPPTYYETYDCDAYDLRLYDLTTDGPQSEPLAVAMKQVDTNGGRGLRYDEITAVEADQLLHPNTRLAIP